MRKSWVVIFLVGVVSSAAWAQSPDLAAGEQIFKALNQERTQRGLPALKWDDRLAQAAVDHTRLLVEHQELSHQFAGEPALRLRYARYKIRLDAAGENVAYDSTVDGAHEGFMQSPPHRANILSTGFDTVGVAVIFAHDLYFVTQDFAHLTVELTASAAEDHIAQHLAQFRSQRRERPLKRVTLGEVRDMACRMAKDQQPEPNLARGIDGARNFVAFTMSDPRELPKSLTEVRLAPEVDRFAIGTCFQSSTDYPNGVYWVMVVFMQPPRFASRRD